MADWFETRFREPVDAGQLDPAFVARMRALVVEEWQADAGTAPPERHRHGRSRGRHHHAGDRRPPHGRPTGAPAALADAWLLVAAAVAVVAVVGTLLVAAGGDDDAKQIDTVTPSPSSDDGPSILVKGDVQLVGDGVAGLSVLEITAEEDDGEVTGKIVFTDSDNDPSAVVTVECADTDTDGLVILSGKITSRTQAPGTEPALGSAQQMFDPQIVLFIREGDPDSVAIFVDEGKDASCSDSLAHARDVLDSDIDQSFVEVDGDGDIETG